MSYMNNNAGIIYIKEGGESILIEALRHYSIR